MPKIGIGWILSRGRARSSRRFSQGAAALCLAVGSLGGQLALADAGSGHCVPGETVFFSCSVGAKTVSVCGSSNLSAQSGWVEYRYGPIGSPELVLPRTRVHPRGVVQAGTWAFSGGGGAFLQFRGRPYTYAVYTAIGQGWDEKAGVVVRKGDKTVANLPCRGPVQSELGPDLFERAGLGNEPDAFDLP